MAASRGGDVMTDGTRDRGGAPVTGEGIRSEAGPVVSPGGPSPGAYRALTDWLRSAGHFAGDVAPGARRVVPGVERALQGPDKP